MKDNTIRNPFVAALLSLLAPGVGQMYAGQWKRGLTLLIGLTAQAALFVGVGMPWLIYGLGLIWLWNIYDAYQTAGGRTVSATLPALLIVVLNLIPAWQVTEIRIPELQPQQRKTLGEIASNLRNPDFVAEKTTEQKASAKYIVPGPGAPANAENKPPKEGEPGIQVSPIKARKGQAVTVRGTGFAPNRSGRLILLGTAETPLAKLRTDSEGRFEISFANPRYIPGDYFIQAVVITRTGHWQISDTLSVAAPMMFQTIYLALIGTVLSLIFALPLSFLGARNLMSGSVLLKLIYAAVRGLFTILRSVEVLIIAVMAVVVLGIGPFAGVVALAIHGIGALGKLYSEAIESIDHGPIEAIRSTGANDFQVTLFAVVPQVVPQFIAFTLYRWDINVRMATVIGLVGGGGIGYQLIQYMNLFQWRQAATAIWLIAAVVMLMDYASAVIREKLM